MTRISVCNRLCHKSCPAVRVASFDTLSDRHSNMSLNDSESVLDFHNSQKHRLDYLCLPEEQNVSAQPSEIYLCRLDLQRGCIEIKLVASFDYVKMDQMHCVLPTITSAVLSSVPLAPGSEQASIEKISDIFQQEFLIAYRQRAFSWDTVEIPTPTQMTSESMSFLFLYFFCIRSLDLMNQKISMPRSRATILLHPTTCRFSFPIP